MIFLAKSSPASMNTLAGSVLSAVTGDFGNILVQQIQAGRFTIYYNQYQIKKDSSFYFAMNGPSLELHFMLQNQMEYKLSELGVVETIEKEFNLTYLPYIENRTSFKAGNTCTTFDIHFPVPYLEEYATVHPLINSFRDQVIQNRAIQYSSGKQVAGFEMIGIINHILFNDYAGAPMLFYLESKAVELLLLSLRALSMQTNGSIKPRPGDIERIHEAEAIIMSNLENPYSLIELSRKAGINDFKLKKLFKHIYGTTVFDYLMQAKMKKAKSLVLETELPFSEIAFQTGFKNVPNFNEAFRRKFACTPGYMRKHK